MEEIPPIEVELRLGSKSKLLPRQEQFAAALRTAGPDLGYVHSVPGLFEAQSTTESISAVSGRVRSNCA